MTSQFQSEYNRLNALGAVAGDADLLAELLGVFLSDIPARLQTLESAASAEDFGTVAHEAHAIKGSCGTIAAHANMQRMQALECAARQGDGATVAEIWMACMGEMQRLLQDLHVEYENLRRHGDDPAR
ncbi:Hpt domain-containing protein [Silvimonas sp.]|uniref:Hpt domain-containing protein n=1 Tax=Silvimonas sp. TaxID=2650811 RepID=UPI002849771B|nr:Hpt domain-containing protein [Silvimonas sp.]MDR3426322.1 Hpt domain-containing protein [Silvimonas sp.]